ncbi:MAG TPA: hypothetical protein VHV30_07530 [Polyangiaceae bacterium]|nr:hypothetical protein [Polyangiaceae bacterium]
MAHVLAVALAGAFAACTLGETLRPTGSTGDDGPGFEFASSSGGSDDSAATGDDGLDLPDACVDGGLCTNPSCNGQPTRLLGTVYDPGGTTPLPGVQVFVTLGTLPAITPGLAADTCAQAALIKGLAITVTTDESGRFAIADAPSGSNVPLVMQIGKWRREVFVPSVVPCTDNALPASLTRLPRNRSEGDLPQIAVLTGACDRLACLFARIGVDPSEFTGPTGGGRVHVYRGAGPGPDLEGGGAGPAGDCTGAVGACPLWSTATALSAYDLVALGCECGENNQTKPDRTPMYDWLNAGGQLVAIHDQETWLKDGPGPFPSVATWSDSDATAPGPYTVPPELDASPFAAWLDAGAGTLALDPSDVAATVTRVDEGVARAWITAGDPLDGGTVAAFVVSTRFAADGGVLAGDAGAAPAQGRAIVTDIHVGANGATSTAGVPGSCATGPLTPEERALESMIFDQTFCDESPVLLSPVSAGTH